MLAIYALFPTLLAALATALPYSIGGCPGAAERPTGRGYAAFRRSQGHWQAGNVLGEGGVPKPYDQAYAPSLIECTNLCEAHKAQSIACVGVSWTERGQNCDLWTRGSLWEVDPNYLDHVPRMFERAAIPGSCAVKGAAMRSTNNAPFECCDIWY